MALANSKAVIKSAPEAETAVSFKIMSFLLDRAIERAGEASAAAANQQWHALATLTQKSVALINGLNGSLNADESELSRLYSQMLDRIQRSDPPALKEAFIQVTGMLEQIKLDWSRKAQSQQKYLRAC